MKRLLLLCLLIGLVISLPIISSGQKTIKIDCNIPAYLPDQTWSIDTISRKGRFEYTPQTAKLINLTEKRSLIKTAILADRMKHDACPAQLLDYLLAHQDIIPVEWQSKTIIFTGTLYHDSTGLECYRTMYYDGSTWDWNRTYPTDSCDNCATIVTN